MNTVTINGEVYTLDDNGKMSACEASISVPRGANKQCSRPKGHEGEHRFADREIDLYARANQRLTKALAAQRAELTDLRAHATALRNELQAAREALIWCANSEDFGAHGKARDGWLKGPHLVIERAGKVLAGEIPSPPHGTEVP